MNCHFYRCSIFTFMRYRNFLKKIVFRVLNSFRYLSIRRLNQNVQAKKWQLVVQEARYILDKKKSSSNKAFAAAALVSALRSLHDYQQCVEEFRKHQQLILHRVSFERSRKALLSCCQSLNRLGVYSDTVHLVEQLPRKYLKSPSVSGVLQSALLRCDVERSLVAAQHAHLPQLAHLQPALQGATATAHGPSPTSCPPHATTHTQQQPHCLCTAPLCSTPIPPFAPDQEPLTANCRAHPITVLPLPFAPVV